MTSTLPVLRRVVSARLYGTAEVPMSLEYTMADPVAIALTLGSCGHRRTWHVARAVLAAGLAEAPTSDADCWDAAGDVLVSRLPGSRRALMGLRSRPHRWLVTVAASDLDRFLGRTFTACPLEQEAQLVAKELDVQIGFFNLADGGGNPG